MKNLEQTLKTLARKYPNDMIFGSEVRNIVYKMKYTNNTIIKEK